LNLSSEIFSPLLNITASEWLIGLDSEENGKHEGKRIAWFHTEKNSCSMTIPATKMKPAAYLTQAAGGRKPNRDESGK
jgi:hypothetical protein